MSVKLDVSDSRLWEAMTWTIKGVLDIVTVLKSETHRVITTIATLSKLEVADKEFKASDHPS